MTPLLGDVRGLRSGGADELNRGGRGGRGGVPRDVRASRGSPPCPPWFNSSAPPDSGLKEPRVEPVVGGLEQVDERRRLGEVAWRERGAALQDAVQRGVPAELELL